MDRKKSNRIVKNLRSRKLNYYLKMIMHHSSNRYVYWRISFVISCVTLLFLHVYFRISKIYLNMSSYFTIFIITWFANYWGRNYLDFHYINNDVAKINHLIDTIQNKNKHQQLH